MNDKHALERLRALRDAVREETRQAEAKSKVARAKTVAVLAREAKFRTGAASRPASSVWSAASGTPSSSVSVSAGGAWSSSEIRAPSPSSSVPSAASSWQSALYAPVASATQVDATGRCTSDFYVNLETTLAYVHSSWIPVFFPVPGVVNMKKINALRREWEGRALIVEYQTDPDGYLLWILVEVDHRELNLGRYIDLQKLRRDGSLRIDIRCATKHIKRHLEYLDRVGRNAGSYRLRFGDDDTYVTVRKFTDLHKPKVGVAYDKDGMPRL